MALKDLYYKAEDKYYAFLDWLDARGLPIYGLVDAFEDKGVPTFPIALIILVIAIGSLAWLALGIAMPANSLLTISVSDSAGKAIADADVVITLPNGIVQTASTNASGKAQVQVPINQEVGIKITKGLYKDSVEKFKAAKLQESLPIVLELLRKTLTKTIQLMEKGTTELVKKEVQIEFSCSAASDYSETKTTSNGIIELTTIPETCGTLYATPKNGFATEQDAIELGTAGATLNIFLSEEAKGKGTITVSVANELQQAIAGIEISLMDESGMLFARKTTTASGSAAFTEVPAGKYYLAAYDASGKYADHDGRANITELQAEAKSQVSVTLFTKAVGKIMLLLKDSATNQPISSARVKLIKDGAEFSSKESDIDGKVEFNVSENVLYDLAIDHPAYMLKTLKNQQKSGAYVDVLLAPATKANANSLKVKVVDFELTLPVEDVKVRLHKSADDAIVGSELTTGINGEVVFERLESDNYYAEVLKTGFGSAVSDIVQVIARQENSVVVRLAIGSGAFDVSVLDEEKKPLAAAKVEVYNAYTNARLSENTTDLQGKKAIDERVDRKIYFVASASGYLKHTTIAFSPTRDVTQKIEIALEKDIPKLEVKILGIFATEDLELSDSLSPGQKYVAKIQLLVPANSNFDEIGVHLRTGSDDALIMEKDAIYLRNIFASTTGITKGTSYTPPNNYATDAMHLTTGNAKWANIIWKNASDGIYDAEAEIIAKDGIAIGTLTELQYRGWGKKGAYVRAPTDAVLGNAENAGSKQALYAQTSSLPLSIGPSNLCDDTFCYRLIMEDFASGNLQTSIVDSYSAKVSNDYKFIFTITSKSSTTFAGSKLKIYNESGSLAFSGYEITTVTGATIPGTLTGASLEIDVGDVATNSKFYGNLEMRTIKEGSALLKLELISGNEKVMQKSIALNVAGAKALNIELLPKIIVPFVQNNLLIRVTDSNDGSALADATVTILKSGSIIASGTTDFNGIFAYALASVSAGTSLEFRAEKSNYKQNSLSISVSEEIISTSPEKISETLTIGGADKKDVELRLNNITELPLKISSAEISGDLDGLAIISFNDNYDDAALPKGEDFNLEISLDLTDSGKQVEEITKLSASIDITLEGEDASASWRISVPVTITIGFGAEADDSDCLVINPNTWDLFASTGSKTLNIALQNNCEVGGEEVILRSLQAKITQANDNALGTFEISSDLEGSATIVLTNTYATIAPTIEPNASATLKLEFEPEDVVSGEATYNIVLKALNKTANGDEEISTQLKVNAKVNDLQECVEVIQSAALVIESCPYNLGYGAYGGSGGGYGGGYGYGGAYGGYGGGAGYGGMGGYSGATYNPYQQWGYTPNSQPWVGNYDQLYANNYPYSNYQQPFYGSDYGTGGYGGIQGGIGGYGASFNCGRTSFTVRNNCSSAVEISLSSDPALIVDKATTELSAGEELEAEVQAAYMVGNYPIDVKARVADSKEASTTIETLMVKVDNIFTKTWFDCVQLDKKKFQFNDFIGKPVSGKVFNDCYDSGVRLIYSADAIKISEGVYGTKTTPEGKTMDLRMVQEVAVTGIYTEGAGDHTREILQFDIIKDVRYKGDRPNLTASNPLAQIGNLRYALTAGYYAVESRATMSVEFITRYGTKERIPFNIVLEDLWLAADVLPAEKIFGGAKNLDECINKDALDFTKLSAFGDTCLPVTDAGLFPGRIFRHPPEAAKLPTFMNMSWYLPFYTPNNSQNWIMKVSEEFCGSVDKIELKTPELPAKQGVKVRFETTQNGHDVSVIVDAREIKPNATARFDAVIQIIASRPAKNEAKLYSLPFKFCVQGEKVPVIPIMPTQAGLKCGIDGRTGDNAFTGYGFANLKYNWDWEKIGRRACDRKENSAEFIVCDATQFSIGLNKKANEIRKLIGNIETAKAGLLSSVLDESMKGKNIGEFKNIDNLFRFVKRQMNVEKSIVSGAAVTKENYAFFIDSAGNIIKNEAVEAKLTALNGIVGKPFGSFYSNIGEISGKSAQIVNERKKLKDPNDLIMKISEDKVRFNAEERAVLDKLGFIINPQKTTPAPKAASVELNNITQPVTIYLPRPGVTINSVWTKQNLDRDAIEINVWELGSQIEVQARMTITGKTISTATGTSTSEDTITVGEDRKVAIANADKVAITHIDGEEVKVELKNFKKSPFRVDLEISSVLINPEENGKVYDALYRTLSSSAIPIGISGEIAFSLENYNETYKRLYNVIASGKLCQNSSVECCDALQEKATYCWITKIGETTPAAANQVKITNSLLNKLHDSLEFTVGIRNKYPSSAALSAAEKKIVLENGADDTSLLPEIEGGAGEAYASLDDFWKENIAFSSYLMHDGYSKEFKTDFNKLYGEAQKTTYPLVSNFGGDKSKWTLKTKGGNELVIETPALYNTSIGYDWKTAADPSITVSVDTATPVEHSDISDLMKQNIFFYLPLDGLVGYNAATDTVDRKGYGTTWSDNPAKNQKADNQKDQAAAKTPLGYSGITGIKRSMVNEGAEIFNVTSDDSKYEALKEGIVLSINRNKDAYKINYSNAVPVKLKIIKNNLNKGAGLFYELYSSNTGEEKRPGLRADVINTPKNKSIFNWLPVSATDFEGKSLPAGQSIPESYAFEGALCNGGNEYHALLWDKVTSVGEMDLKTVAYTPAQFTYGMELLCGADTTVLSNSESSLTTAWARGGTDRFLLSEGKGTDVENEFTLTAIQAKLKSGQICMKTSANEATFFWNAEKILESGASAIASSATSSSGTGGAGGVDHAAMGHAP